MYKWASGELCIHDTQQDIQKICPADLPQSDRIKPDCTMPLAGGGRQIQVQWPPLPEPLRTPRILQKKIFDVVPFVDNGLVSRQTVLEKNALLRGYLYDFLLLPGGTIAVSASDPVDDVESCGTSPGTLLFLDQETFAEISRVPVDGCIRVMAPDPAGEGFLGLMVVEASTKLTPDVRLVRFSPNGTIEDSVLIADATGADGIYFDPTTPDRIFSAFRTDTNRDLGNLRIGEHSVTDLQETFRNDLGGLRTDMGIVRMDFEGSNTLAFALDPIGLDGRRLCRFSLSTRTLTCILDGCGPQSILAERTIFLDFVRHDPTGLLLSVGGLDAQVVLACAGGPAALPVAFPGFQGILLPGAVAEDPSDPSRTWLFGARRISQNEWGGGYVVFEPSSGWTVPAVFPLPGSVVSTRRVDSQNRLWLLQPWDAAIIRVDTQ